MNQQPWGVNTLVFQHQIESGTSQASLFAGLYDLGVRRVEVRREYIRDFDTELMQIRDAAEKYAMELFYSVPAALYKNGKVQQALVEQFFAEAKAMGCTHVKLIIGEYASVTPAQVGLVNDLCARYGVCLTVENDQTAENGRAEKIKTFLDELTALGGKVSATFDIGNWLYQQQDPLENALLLREHVSYIHLKDVVRDAPPRTVLLGEGDIDWRAVLQHLPQDVPIALEYPCGKDAWEQLKIELAKLMCTG